jgi:uncharacterized protein (DUF433 family)
MLRRLRTEPDLVLLGVGFYSLGDAGRLLRVPARNIRRWLGGYRFRSQDGEVVTMAPLWKPELPRNDNHIELGFRDLIELRFVAAFQEAGVGTLAIRRCIEFARDLVDDDRPFSTRRFKTDGKTIFIEWARKAGEIELLDLRRKQYVWREVIERTFKDLDIEDDAVARWRPFRGKASIVIDPQRAFGQPIVTKYGVPTVALSDAVEAEGSVDRVARIFDVSATVVRDAVAFEKYLSAA